MDSTSPSTFSNFVLAESILVFCWLMKFLFQEANPAPTVLRLTVGFDNLTRPAGPATLSDVPEGRMRIERPRKASAPNLEVYKLAELIDYDPERLAFLLVADIYHWFGYESMNVPYIDDDGTKQKLSAPKIINGPLPETVATPDYL